ncbi:MAG TPA: ABC transporter permease [Ruminococcaceae bacterium]|nr:ABC transporter permease [Oscillospiraceae bacterium]
MKKFKHFLLSNNMIIVYIILAFSVVVAIRESAFLGVPTLVNLARGSIVTLCFALCEMLIMIAGGIDVSFPAIACVSMYVPMYLFNNGITADSGFLFVVIAVLCGLCFGLFNGFLVSCIKIPSLIATLATSAIASGGLAFLFGVKTFSKMPTALSKIYNMNLLVYADTATGLSYPLTGLVLVPVLLSVVIAVLLKYTMLGRGLYALGGNPDAARTVGFPVRRLQFFAYAFSGTVAGIAAVIYVVLMQSCGTTDLMGREMLVVAACVVGGCSLTGGDGTVSGAVLGTILITLVQNNLNMLGVDTKWQTFAVGVVLLFGVLLTALRGKLKKGKWGGRTNA